MKIRLELPVARDEDGWRRTLNRVQNAQVEAEVRGVALEVEVQGGEVVDARAAQ